MIRFSAVLSCACLLAASTASADEAESVAVPLGAITITKTDGAYEATVFGGNQSFTIESAYMPSVIGTRNNSVLLFTTSGGTACPGEYTWVTLDQKGLRATEKFGTCSDLGELQDTADGPMLVMPRLAPAGTAGFVLNDDETITEVELGLAPSGVTDVKSAAAWTGKTAYDVLTAPEMEASLLELMSWSELEAVRNAAPISSNTLSDDGEWVFAAGCMPHNCNEASSGVAISKNDGRVIVGYWTLDARGQLYGKPDSTLPNGMRALLASGY